MVQAVLRNFKIATFCFFTCNFLLRFLLSMAQNVSVIYQTCSKTITREDIMTFVKTQTFVFCENCMQRLVPPWQSTGCGEFDAESCDSVETVAQWGIGGQNRLAMVL